MDDCLGLRYILRCLLASHRDCGEHHQRFQPTWTNINLIIQTFDSRHLENGHTNEILNSHLRLESNTVEAYIAVYTVNLFFWINNQK